MISLVIRQTKVDTKCNMATVCELGAWRSSTGTLEHRPQKEQRLDEPCEV